MVKPRSDQEISNHAIDHSVGASDERLLNQSHSRMVEHPHAVMLKRGIDVDCVHYKHLSIGGNGWGALVVNRWSVSESQSKCSAICRVARDGVP